MDSVIDGFEFESYETHDITLICTSFTMLYLYFWLDMKDVIMNDIETAYGSVKKKLANEDNDTDETNEDLTLEVEIPYDPGSIIGPLFGCIIKALLMAFVLFLVVNVMIIVLSQVTMLGFTKNYLKDDVAQALEAMGAFKEGEFSFLPKALSDNLPATAPITRPQQTGGALFSTKTEEELQEEKEEKRFKALQKQEDEDRKAAEKRKADEIKAIEKLAEDERKALEKEQLREKKAQDRQNKQEQKAKQKQERAEEKAARRKNRLENLYAVGKDIPIIFALDGNPPIDDAELLAFDKAKGYWLFFLQEYKISIIMIIVTMIVNYSFTKLIIPHIKDIETDVLQMKGQVEVLLYANLTIYLGGIWFMAFRTLS